MRFHLLDPLRGMAALWVFTYHYTFSTAFRQSFPFLHELFKQGDRGVPVFFVISGFCIMATAKSLIRRAGPSRDFLVRRALRIFPTYWASILVVIAVPFTAGFLGMLKSGLYGLPHSGDEWRAPFHDFDFFEWIRYASLTQVFYPFPDANALSVKFTELNAVYWSLAIEFQFYVVVAVALTRRQHFIGILALITIISVPFVFWPASTIFGIFLPYWPMFVFGMLVYLLLEIGTSPQRMLGARHRMLATVLVGAIGVLYAFTVLMALEVEPVVFAAFFAIATWCLFALDDSFVNLLYGGFLPGRVLAAGCAALGSMSYSLYLLHGRLQQLTTQFVRQILPMNSIAHDVGAIVLTCLLVYGFYVLFEAPFAAASARRRG